MTMPYKILVISLTSLFLLPIFLPIYSLEAKSNFVPRFVSDTMPDSIRVKLNNISLCNLRNQRRAQLVPPLPALVCDDVNPQLDPDIYTMDQYVTGVLKNEVGPVAAIAHWHIEALKAMAVTARTFGWGRAILISGVTYQIDSTGQTFFPEKGVDDEQKYQGAATLTTGQYLSHLNGSGASQIISAQYRRQNGNPTNPCSLRQGNCPL